LLRASIISGGEHARSDVGEGKQEREESEWLVRWQRAGEMHCCCFFPVPVLPHCRLTLNIGRVHHAARVTWILAAGGVDVSITLALRGNIIRAGLVPKNLAKWYCITFRCYLTNIVQSWFN
jgi:hypothetical protein